MNTETVYSFLMGLGWFFLLGWVVGLVVACASVFWPDQLPRFRTSPKPARGRLEVE